MSWNISQKNDHKIHITIKQHMYQKIIWICLPPTSTRFCFNYIGRAEKNKGLQFILELTQFISMTSHLVVYWYIKSCCHMTSGPHKENFHSTSFTFCFLTMYHENKKVPCIMKIRRFHLLWQCCSVTMGTAHHCLSVLSSLQLPCFNS